jgi:mRNA-degrading endonuclease RelE of RelBE toxin-antitoxin system
MINQQTRPYIFSNQAQEAFLALPERRREQINAALIREREHILRTYRPSGITIKHREHGSFEKGTYRLRCGEYRIVYRVQNLIPYIESIMHRREVYR